MLNAELKSMNSNLTYMSILSRCVRAGWRAVAMASSVERLDPYANWKGSREGGRTDLMCCMTSRSKHFMRIGVSATGSRMEMTSGPRLRKFLSEVHSELQSPPSPPHFHALSETQVSVLELRSSSRLQKAPGGLLHCSHPLTSRTPTPIHSGSECLHHRRGSSAVSIPRRASPTPPLRLLLQEAFPGAAHH